MTAAEITTVTITRAVMASVVAGAGVNPADQRWGFWPLLPVAYHLQEEF